jgi:hypothetical protein
MMETESQNQGGGVLCLAHAGKKYGPTYCTEIVMLIQQQHVDIPLFDTTSIHAEEAVLEAIR